MTRFYSNATPYSSKNSKLKLLILHGIHIKPQSNIIYSTMGQNLTSGYWRWTPNDMLFYPFIGHQRFAVNKHGDYQFDFCERHGLLFLSTILIYQKDDMWHKSHPLHAVDGFWREWPVPSETDRRINN